MDKLNIGVFQTNVAWLDIKGNQEKIVNLINTLSSYPDIIILPEMYTTGFLMEIDEFSREELINQAEWQRQLSIKTGISLMGSIAFPEGNTYKNRFLFTGSNGITRHYDKRHLFTLGGETKNYTNGVERVVFEYNGFNFMPQICYDLRFPVWSRNDLGYNIIIYVANWPSSRQFIWNILLKSRAIENQSYVIGVNRVGVDNNNIKYSGGSLVCGPDGKELLLLNNKEQYSQITISLEDLNRYRNRFPFLSDADNFEIKKPDNKK